jgi:lipid II:glycine glycyltransferase (peptidoglycan interpeptide bridge formation enzyme)
MEFINLKEPGVAEQLNKFVVKNSVRSGAEFLQSFSWGEITLAEGEEILRVAAREKEEWRAAATLIKKKLPANNFYWYAPRGPLGTPAGINFLISEIKKLSPRAVFFRLEPGTLDKAAPFSLIRIADLQPRKTLVLDLGRSEEELLRQMQQKTRYNIRLAEKKGVKIRAGGEEDFPEFWRLLNKTSRRDVFRLHAEKHYRNLISADKNFIKLFFACYEGKNIAAGIFCFFGDKVTYLHGASDNEFRNIMAPHLLQWELIKEARRDGYKYYDFYGIDGKKWPGVTRFKLGFGGQAIEYPGTFDFVFRPFLYRLYALARKLRRWG